MRFGQTNKPRVTPKMNDRVSPSPMSFVWTSQNGQLFPQLWTVPRVGSLEVAPVRGPFLLKPNQHDLTLDELAAIYPPPLQS